MAFEKQITTPVCYEQLELSISKPSLCAKMCAANHTFSVSIDYNYMDLGGLTLCLFDKFIETVQAGFDWGAMALG